MIWSYWLHHFTSSPIPLLHSVFGWSWANKEWREGGEEGFSGWVDSRQVEFSLRLRSAMGQTSLKWMWCVYSHQPACAGALQPGPGPWHTLSTATLRKPSKASNPGSPWSWRSSSTGRCASSSQGLGWNKRRSITAEPSRLPSWNRSSRWKRNSFMGTSVQPGRSWKE